MRRLPPPLTTWIPGTDVDLPAFDRGTLIVHDVDGLDLAAQRILLTWLEDRTSHVRVITTVTRDLFAMVTAGVFLDQLYYRLNTIVVDAVRGDEQSAPKLKYGMPPPGTPRS